MTKCQLKNILPRDFDRIFPVWERTALAILTNPLTKNKQKCWNSPHSTRTRMCTRARAHTRTYILKNIK